MSGLARRIWLYGVLVLGIWTATGQCIANETIAEIPAWLQSPGVKVLGIDFYTEGCAPCKAAAPKWKKLQEQYGSQGFRLAIVSVGLDYCPNFEWAPDFKGCDSDNKIAKDWKITKLPDVFLVTWQGKFLLQHGTVDEATARLADYFAKEPRVLIDTPTDVAGGTIPIAEAEELKALLKAELQSKGKIVLVPEDKAREEIKAQRAKQSGRVQNDDAFCPRLGHDLPANSVLKTKATREAGEGKLILELQSLDGNCPGLNLPPVPIRNNDRALAIGSAVATLLRRLWGELAAPNADNRLANQNLFTLAGIRNQGKLGKFEEPSLDMGEAIINPKVDTQGYLKVFCAPEGGTILVNGKEQGLIKDGSTPKIFKLMTGRYVVACKNGALFTPASQDINLSTEGATLELELPSNYGELEVTSSPPKAEILLNDEETGQVTPFNFGRKRAGTYKVTLRKERFLSKDIDVILDKGKKERVEARLERNCGNLQINSTPSGATISIEGQATRNKTPVTLSCVPLGAPLIAVELPGYRARPERATIEQNKESVLNFTLEAVFGRIIVEAYLGEEMVEAAVEVDDEAVGTAPYKAQLPAGRHVVKVNSSKARREFTKTVDIKDGQETAVEARLIPNTHANGQVSPNEEAIRPNQSAKTAEPQPLAIPSPRTDSSRSTIGHALFWPGLSLAAFGGLSTGMAFRAGDRHAKQANTAWSALAWTGYIAGGGLMLGGVFAWALPAKSQGSGGGDFSFAVAPGSLGSQGATFSLSGKW